VLKVAVIGAGVMGENHIRTYSTMPNVELAGISDISQARVSSLAARYNTRGFTSHRELLKLRPDIVSVATPTLSHRQATLDCLEAGANVLVEKPIANGLEDARIMAARAREFGLKLMVGHIKRFNPAVIALKKAIDDKKIGHIVSISTKRVGPYNPRIRDVGIIMDLGVHDIDILHFILGHKARRVYASAGSTIPTAAEDHATLMLGFENGYSAVIETNWLTPHKVREISVVGTEGIAEADLIECSLTLHDKDWVRSAKVERAEPLRKELEHFIDCVERNREPLVSGEDGMAALSVALAAIESYNSKNVLPIEY